MTGRLQLGMLCLFGWLLARSPRLFPRLLCRFVAWLIYFLLPRKRRILLRNLHAAFPDLSPPELRSLARESIRQMVSFALLAGAQPFFRPDTLKTLYHVPPETVGILRNTLNHNQPSLVLIPHLGPQECHTALPALLDFPVGEVGVIYRPLDARVVDQWIRKSRERFGLKLLSRKSSLPESLGLLRRNGSLVLLFDQSAGDRHGGLMTFFNQPCTGTPFVGMLANRFRPKIILLHAQPTGFWQVRFVAREVPADLPPEHCIFHAHQELEKLLREEPALRPAWLWMHDRWKTQRDPARLFHLQAKYDWRGEETAFAGHPPVYRPNLCLILLPEDSGLLHGVLPALFRLRDQRPDLQLIGIGQLPPGLTQNDAPFRRILPKPGGKAAVKTLRALAGEFPLWGISLEPVKHWPKVFTLTKPLLTAGILAPGVRDPGLTHAWRIPPGLSPGQWLPAFLASLGDTVDPITPKV